MSREKPALGGPRWPAMATVAPCLLVALLGQRRGWSRRRTIVAGTVGAAVGCTAVRTIRWTDDLLWLRAELPRWMKRWLG